MCHHLLPSVDENTTTDSFQPRRPSKKTMSSNVNNQAPPPASDAGRTPDTVATVSDSLSFTNSILIVLIGYLLWKLFGKRIGQSKLLLQLYLFSFTSKQKCHSKWIESVPQTAAHLSLPICSIALLSSVSLCLHTVISFSLYKETFAPQLAKLSSSWFYFSSTSFV